MMHIDAHVIVHVTMCNVVALTTVAALRCRVSSITCHVSPTLGSSLLSLVWVGVGSSRWDVSSPIFRLFDTSFVTFRGCRQSTTTILFPIFFPVFYNNVCKSSVGLFPLTVSLMKTYHGIIWCAMVYQGISLYYMILHGIPWYTMTLHSKLW